MDDILELLLENSTRLITLCESSYERYFTKSIDYTQKMVGLVGARGVGKTTAILQHLQAVELPFEKKLYISAYKDLAENYLAKVDASEYLGKYTVKSEGVYLPKNEKIKGFVEHYYARYKEIGQQTANL